MSLPKLSVQKEGDYFLLPVHVDVHRYEELGRLFTAIQKRQDIDDWKMVGEVFALGIQAAWLRLSKGEHIGPRPTEGY